MTSSIKPTCFKIDMDNDKMYYNSKELFEYIPEFYYGCKTKPRSIIQKKKIPETEFIYANLKMNEWKLSSADCKKAQLLLSKEWVERNIFKITESTQASVERLNTNENENVNEEEEEEEKQRVEAIEIIEKAPPLLHLKNEEKFKDIDENIIEIETRGEKNRNKIYFKVKDIMTGFEMPNLDTTISHKEYGYEKNIDYKTFFIRAKPDSQQSLTIKKCLYLTYEGLLRVLFVSRNKNATNFREWATNKLFTIQMGSNDEKQKVAYQLIQSAFETCASKFPTIYLFKLGSVELLRNTFEIDINIPDNSNVYKFGCTDDMARRTGELGVQYNKLQNVDIKLSTWHPVDTIYKFDAENEIRDLCKTFIKTLKVEGFNELIILNKEEYKFIEKHYKRTGIAYAGATAESQREIHDLKEKIRTLEMSHANDLLEKELIIQKITHENATLKTQIETNEKYHKLEIDNKNLELQLASK
jgi:hypothetical protein